MSTSFKGRAILPGKIEGKALVTHAGFNTYASFFTSIHTPVEAARCADRGNQELYGKNLTDKISCLPKTIGSTSSGAASCLAGPDSNTRIKVTKKLFSPSRSCCT